MIDRWKQAWVAGRTKRDLLETKTWMLLLLITEKNLSPTVPFCYQWVNLSFKTKTWMLLFLITEKNLPPMVPFCYRWVDLASVKRVRFIWMISKITICRHWRYKGQYLMSTKIRIQGKLVSNFPQQKILLSHFQIAA